MSENYKRISVRVPLDLYLLVKEEASNLGIPVSSLFNVAMKEYLKTNSVLSLSTIYQSLLDKENTD